MLTSYAKRTRRMYLSLYIYTYIVVRLYIYTSIWTNVYMDKWLWASWRDSCPVHLRRCPCKLLVAKAVIKSFLDPALTTRRVPQQACPVCRLLVHLCVSCRFGRAGLPCFARSVVHLRHLCLSTVYGFQKVLAGLSSGLHGRAFAAYLC